MEILTKDQIEKVCEEYKQALFKKLELQARLTRTKVEEVRVHKGFLLARDELQALKLN